MNRFPRRQVRRIFRGGFTLAEVLIALGIFAIGMIAVASLFPVAAILQKETADDIIGQQSTTNARAIIEAIGLTYDPSTAFADDLDNYHLASIARFGPGELSSVVPISDLTTQPGGTSFFDRFTLAERSFPSTEVNPIRLSPPPGQPVWPTNYEFRDHYWFFFVRDSAGVPTGPNWQGYVLIADREEGQLAADVAAGVTLGMPTDLGTPYITIDGRTGTFDPNNPPANNVYFHPEGIAVETFTFETIAP